MLQKNLNRSLFQFVVLVLLFNLLFFFKNFISYIYLKSPQWTRTYIYCIYIIYINTYRRIRCFSTSVRLYSSLRSATILLSRSRQSLPLGYYSQRDTSRLNIVERQRGGTHKSWVHLLYSRKNDIVWIYPTHISSTYSYMHKLLLYLYNTRGFDLYILYNPSSLF